MSYLVCRDEQDVVRRRTQVIFSGALPFQVRREPSAPLYDAAGERTGLRLTTTLSYDRGLVETVELDEGYGDPPRGQTFQYDDLEHMFLSAVHAETGASDASGTPVVLSSYRGWEPSFGIPLIQSDPAGGIAEYKVDGLGRLAQSRAFDGDWVTDTYVGSPSGYSVVTSGTPIVDTTQHFDALGRPAASEAAGFAGASDSVEYYHYDERGFLARTDTARNAASVNRPRFEHSFDNAGRLLTTGFAPDTGASARTVLSHERALIPSPSSSNEFAAVLRTTDAEGLSREAWSDLTGRLVRGRERVTGAIGSCADCIDTDFTRDLQDVLRDVTLRSASIGAENVRSTAPGDRLGRPTSVADPDRGTTTVRFNAFHQIVFQQDDTGHQVHFRYDLVGRLVEREDVDSGASSFTRWQWDTAPDGLGRVDWSQSPDGHIISYEYDSYGRLTAENHMAGRIDYHLDAATGRLASIEYPSVGGTRLHLEYVYSDGYLERIQELATSDPVWIALARDARGRVTSEETGGGATSTREFDDLTGRLSSLRIDDSSGAGLLDETYSYFDNGRMRSRSGSTFTDQFTYDPVGRLETWNRSVEAPLPPGVSVTYQYDDLGNIGSVTEAGGAFADVYKYQQVRNGGLHAVTDFNGEPFSYDERGRETVGRDGRVTLAYNGRNRPTLVQAGARQLQLEYDANGSRVVATRTIGGSLELQTEYASTWYERRTTTAGTTHVFYVWGPGGVVAQLMSSGAGGTYDERYVHRDSLGSTVLVTDAAGDAAEPERRYYSPFGARVDASGHLVSPGAVPDVTVGFTGHEPEPAFGMLDMGGRNYDARLRRVLSPDPLTAYPSSARSWNRYTYARNQPLDYTDPTGFCPTGGGGDWEYTEVDDSAGPGGRGLRISHGCRDPGKDPKGDFDSDDSEPFDPIDYLNSLRDFGPPGDANGVRDYGLLPGAGPEDTVDPVTYTPIDPYAVRAFARGLTRGLAEQGKDALYRTLGWSIVLTAVGGGTAWDSYHNFDSIVGGQPEFHTEGAEYALGAVASQQLPPMLQQGAELAGGTTLIYRIGGMAVDAHSGATEAAAETLGELTPTGVLVVGGLLAGAAFKPASFGGGGTGGAGAGGGGAGGGGAGGGGRFLVRRFMSRREYKQLRRVGVVFDRNRGNGIPTTTRNFTPRNQDHARRRTGAPHSEYQVDLDVTDVPRGPTTNTRSGLPEFPIQGNLTRGMIINVRRVPKE